MDSDFGDVIHLQFTYSLFLFQSIDVAAVVAVYDSEGNQVDFAIGKYENIISDSGTIKVDGVTKTDTAAETAKVFIFDKFTTIVPYSEPLPVKVGE